MPLPLLRTGDFGRQDAVAERFMRSSVENDNPLRFGKLFRQWPCGGTVTIKANSDLVARKTS